MESKMERYTWPSLKMPWCCIFAAGIYVSCCHHRQVTLVAQIQVSTELLQKYLDLEKNFFLKFFLRFAGMLAGLLWNVRFLKYPASKVSICSVVPSGLTVEYRMQGKIAGGSRLSSQAGN